MDMYKVEYRFTSEEHKQIYLMIFYLLAENQDRAVYEVYDRLYRSELYCKRDNFTASKC